MNEFPERLPSRPLRNWFLAWHIHTGDPADVIAKGFGLDPVLVREMLSGEVSLMLSGDEVRRVCQRLRIDLIRLYGPRWTASSLTDDRRDVDDPWAEMGSHVASFRYRRWLRSATVTSCGPRT